MRSGKLFSILGILVIACAMLLVPTLATADSVTPASYTKALDIGESVTITKTFTVDKAGELPADIMFLFDTTGSMGSAINTAKSAASGIMSGLDAELGDVRFGVAHYEDFSTSPWGSPGDVPYGSVTPLTSDRTAVQSGINSLDASGGYDIPEADLYALQQAAETTGWDPTAARFIVWLGDAPSHDPVDTSGYPGPTLANTITSLTDVGAMVVALNYGNLDGDGEATVVTGATGGGLYTGTTNPDDIVDLIVDAVGGAVSDYSTVGLEVVGDTGGVDVAISPDSYIGTYDRSVTRTFDFGATFTGITPGTYDFEIAGTVDGVRTAFEGDSITVRPVPEPATLLLVGSGLIGLAGFRRKFKK